MPSDDGQAGAADQSTARGDRRIENAGSDDMGWENEQYMGLCGGDCDEEGYIYKLK